MSRRTGGHEEPRRGAVAGFEIRSELDFRYLRDGSGDELHVREAPVDPPADAEPLLRWVPRDGNPFEASLYAVEDGYVMWIPAMGGFRIVPPAGCISIPPSDDAIRRESRLWGVPAALMATIRGDLSVHAAAVEVGGKALLLCGPSRFGKTTLAVGFLRAGHRVLSEDLTCCRREPSPIVFPGPAMLRVRRDVHDRLGPFDATSVAAEDDDRVHLSLDGHMRGSGDPVPLAGVVFLRRGTPDIELYGVPPERFLPELFTLSFGLPTDTDRARAFGAAVDLASSVPCWLLDRPLRFDLLDEVVARLIDTCLT